MGNQEHAGSNENVWKTKVSDFFAQKLNITSASEEWKKEIPFLNAIPNHLLIDGQLVRFQGMIQDMFDPEFFMSEYKIRDLSSGTIRLASGRYRDFADTGPREEIIHDDAIRDERQTFYCVNVPGEGAWVQDVRKNQFPDFANYSTNALSNQSGTAKRCLEDTHETN